METPSTTSPCICRKRRYASYANRALPLCCARPWTVTLLRPRLRIVSIIPGIDTGEPERTETRSGLSGSPKRFPVARSRSSIFVATSSRNDGGYVPLRRYATHTSQAMVNPGGTGTPRFVISARFAPFPPSTLFISLVPSARPAPKEYTDFVTSAPASEPELVGVRRRRRRVVAREARVAEAG